MSQVECKEECALSQKARAVDDAAASGDARQRSSDKSVAVKLLNTILASLEDDKAENVVSIELAGKSDMADFMVVASGRSTRQVVSISEKLIGRLKHELGLATRIEGKEHGDWILIDAGDVIVHIFRPEVREYYQLEKMWMPAAGTAS